MTFITDKQTLEDLNLLGRFRSDSIFSLYNRVKTAGAEKLLLEMFKAPLTNPEAINKRSGIFSYFQDKKITFPFSNEQFRQMEDYLGGSNAGNYLGVLASLTIKKLTGAVLHDEQFEKTRIGLQQTVGILQDCKTFFRQFTEVNHPFYDELNVAKHILNDKNLKLFAETDRFHAWPLFKLAKYDLHLKHTMANALKRLLDILYQLDLYISVANLAQAKGFAYAKALPGKNNLFNASELRHPAIEIAVANPVSFSQEMNMIFLTGANMAGKSTFMKSFAINVYLAHMGFPVAAKNLEFSVKDGIYTSINVPDNLDMGYSHFYAEVLRVKKVAEEVSEGKDLVIIFDELFKGTNVKDAYDATLAVTAAFSEYRNCLYVISTHIIEAGELLKTQGNIRMLYLPTIMNGTIPRYTYQLQSGISSDRHGMTIIENEGILQLLRAN